MVTIFYLLIIVLSKQCLFTYKSLEVLQGVSDSKWMTQEILEHLKFMTLSKICNSHRRNIYTASF